MIKKHGKEWITVVAIVIVIVVIENILSFLLKPDLLGQEFESDMKQLVAQGKAPNVVMIGDSTTITEFDPIRMEESLDDKNEVVINGGVNGIFISCEKYYLEDLMVRYPIDTVIIGIDYSQLRDEESPRRFSYTLDRLKTPKVWLNAAHDLLMKYDDGKYLLQSYRYGNQFEQIRQNVSDKLAWRADKEANRSSVRGFEPRVPLAIEGGAEIFDFEFESSWIQPIYKNSLSEMLQICKQNGIEVYLFAMPYPTTTLITSPEPLTYLHAYVHEIAVENDVAFYDLNLWKDRANLTKDAEVIDLEHFVGTAATTITDAIAEVVNTTRRGEDAGDYFYANAYEARYALQGIAGMHVTSEREGDGVTVRAETLLAQEEPVEYAFYMVQNSEETLLQDYSEAAQCFLSDDQVATSDSVIVRARAASGSTMWRKLSVK